MHYFNINTMLIRKLMDDSGVSTSSMAKAVGVTARTIQRIRRGQQDRTRWNALRKIACKLGRKPHELTKTYSMHDAKRLFGADDIPW
jgi:plasmid maintenance system antidote protein VapI